MMRRIVTAAAAAALVLLAPASADAASPHLPLSKVNRHGQSIVWHAYGRSVPGTLATVQPSNCRIYVDLPQVRKHEARFPGKGRQAGLLQTVVNHEYIHVLQCRKGYFRGRVSAAKMRHHEYVADAGSFLLGSRWMLYGRIPSMADRREAARLLDGARRR